MRVLFVSHRFPPRRAAGTELYTAQLAAGLRGRGWEPVVFTAEKDIARRHLSLAQREHQGVRVLELVNNLHHGSFRETWEQPEIERIFAGVLERERPDLVHFQHLMYLSVGCVEEAARRGLPALFTLHDYWLQCPRMGQRVHADGTLCPTIDLARCAGCMAGYRHAQNPLERRVAGWIAGLRAASGIDLGGAARRARELVLADGKERGRDPDPAAVAAMERELRAREDGLRQRVARSVALFLSPSRFLRERFVEWGIDPGRIEHLPTGVDLEAFGSAPRIARTDRLRVAFVGSLVPVKGARLLLEAWELLAPELRAKGALTIAGPAGHAPGYQRELAALAQRSGARLAGPLARDEVAALLRSTDLVVVPSLWYENAPLVILEALAARTPLLVSDQGGMAELVEQGLSGFHFPMGDARALAAQLALLLREPARLDALYARPVKLASVAEHVAAVEARYRQALESRDGGRNAPAATQHP